MLVTMRNRLIVEVGTDIIDHPYIQAVDICELEERRRKKKRRTNIVNVYDNRLQTDQAWNKVRSNTKRRALADADSDSIIEGRGDFLRDFNTYTPYWNICCSGRTDAAGLERLVDTHYPILNNKQGKSTQPT